MREFVRYGESLSRCERSGFRMAAPEDDMILPVAPLSHQPGSGFRIVIDVLLESDSEFAEDGSKRYPTLLPAIKRPCARQKPLEFRVGHLCLSRRKTFVG
jgi:hypothetical protein